jgi:hypothetical protein
LPQVEVTCAQAPAPSHVPTAVYIVPEHEAVPQAVDVSAFAQCPSLPATLHARHTPQPVAAQQTPSTHVVPDAHDVPSARVAHAPPPSQKPVVPQVPAPESAQVRVGSAPPGGTGLHVPMPLASAHDMQIPEQAPAQHTPCAHTVDAHSSPTEQNAPSGFLPHEVPLHTLPGEQFASDAQVS